MSEVNVLVTGGAGFIGAHVAEKCLELGHRVIALDDLSGGFEDNVPAGCHFVKGSINDVDLINNLFNEYKFKYVYHLAAYAAEGLSHFIRRFNYTNNVIGSLNLINASVNTGTVERFVFTSSIAVYGAGQVPMDEEMRPQPEDPYGIAKFAVEMDLKAAHEMFGLNFTIFRPHNVYGEKQNLGDRYRNVIGIFMNQVMKGDSMTIFGDGEQTRAFSHIDDVAPLIAKCVEMESTCNEIYNIGADKPYSVNSLAKIIAETFEVEANINYLDARNEVVHAYSNHDKVVQTFGEQDFVTLEKGISQMAGWAKAKGPRQSSTFKGIEILKNLPPSWKAVIED
ncbi:MAG: UDP-glucose 4-epimerase [Opitutae bacterium]|nr:UDP-glucose 4-epimerase [Opitutae bacterium]|tara:strand:+ start:33488 stop:34501 length:1014 start_codon:yes stop_codon:yes gene_type:complete